MMALLIYLLVVFVIATTTTITSADVQLESDNLHFIENLQNEKLQGGSSRVYENEIKKLIETVRKLLQDGNAELGIPPLNPYVKEKLELSFDSKVLSGQMTLDNLKVEGITDFTLTEGTVETIIGVPTIALLKLSLNFGEILLTTKYNGSLNLFEMIDLFGEGDISLAFKNFDISTVIKIEILLSSVKIIADESILAVLLPSTEAKITGLLNDEFMSEIISEQLSDTLTTLAKEEQGRINKILTDVLRTILKQISPVKSEANNENVIPEEDPYRLVMSSIEEIVTTLIEKRLFMKWFTEIYYNQKWI